MLSVFTVLIAIVLCACQSTSQTHEKKAKEETHNKEENIYAKKRSSGQNDWVEYKGDVAHIFFHPLITDRKVAFTGEANQAKGNNDWMITVEEFKRSLDELYKHHYILIDA